VFALTSGLRSRRGPVHAFNPGKVGGLESTFRWDPLAGCDDEATAIRRADAFANSVSLGGVDDGSFWSSKASDYLRSFFCAAAVDKRDFRQVAAWVLGAGTGEAIRILEESGHGQWASTLAELFGPAEKTAATVKMVMSRSIAFMSDPMLAQSVLPAPGEEFDIAGFLAASGSLYLIADGQAAGDSPLASLFACLTTEIHHTAILMGRRRRVPGWTRPCCSRWTKSRRSAPCRCQAGSPTRAARGFRSRSSPTVRRNCGHGGVPTAVG
jgi:type IV secretion system protein VirD4